MSGRDSKEQATRIALVPEHHEIDWELSQYATDCLELGALSFETPDVEGSRWKRSTGSWAWYAMGDGVAALHIPLIPDATIDDDPRYLRVGELLYRVADVVEGPEWGHLVRLQLVDLCAPPEDLAEEADEQWERPTVVES